jgi:hypothetical protein
VGASAPGKHRPGERGEQPPQGEGERPDRPVNLAAYCAQVGQSALGIAVDHPVDRMFEGQCLARVGNQPGQQRLFGRIGGQGGAGLLIDPDVAQHEPSGMGRCRIGPDPVIAEQGKGIIGVAAQLHQPDPQVEILGLGHRGIEPPTFSKSARRNVVPI